MTSKQVTKMLRGSRIARVDLRTYRERSIIGGRFQDVRIHLEGGGILAFTVQEGEHDHGVAMKICLGRVILHTDRAGDGS